MISGLNLVTLEALNTCGPCDKPGRLHVVDDDLIEG